MKDPDLCSPSERISDYAKRRKELRGLSTDEIHGIDSQPNGGYELRLSDIEWQSKRIAELEAQAKASEWQPISTAPKDGTEILLYSPACFLEGEKLDFRVTQGEWSAPSNTPRIVYVDGFAPEPLFDEWEPYWASYDGGFTEEHPPTHWMPLPAAPEMKP